MKCKTEIGKDNENKNNKFNINFISNIRYMVKYIHSLKKVWPNKAVNIGKNILSLRPIDLFF